MMTRIEKTQINCSAFTILTSTLKDVQSDKIIEIVNDGKGVIMRNKKQDEKEDFQIDLKFLEQMFTKLALTDPSPLLVTGDAKEYLKNCSYACYYFRKEKKRRGDFDHFDIFHEIHFQETPADENESILLRQFCRLFRIDFNKCLPYIDCKEISDLTSKLPEKKVFNEIFKTIYIKTIDLQKQIIFDSHNLTMMESLDTLFAIKDLLYSKGIDTTKIPEQNWFTIGQNDEVKYEFTSINGQKIIVTFTYDHVIFTMIKNCG